jgi:hypothetical protein
MNLFGRQLFFTPISYFLAPKFCPCYHLGAGIQHDAKLNQKKPPSFHLNRHHPRDAAMLPVGDDHCLDRQLRQKCSNRDPHTSYFGNGDA